MQIAGYPAIQAALQGLDEQLNTFYINHNLPGLAAGLVYDQALIWSKGYGFANLETGLPADSITVFDTGSISKMFADTMLMMLRDLGLLNLDDPIEKFLPEFRIHNPFSDPRPVTFRQVAGHISGLPREPGYTLVDGRLTLPSMETILDNLSRQTLLYPPMMVMHYSNQAVYIMGHALARIAGQEYKDFIKEHIFDPLGMTYTGWIATPEMETHRALRYVPAYAGRPRRQASEIDFTGSGAPGGGVCSTVENLARFIALQFREGGADQQILGRSTLREMRLPVYGDLGWGVGIGWFFGKIAGQAIISHGGSAPGCSATIHLAPDLKVGLVILYNEMNFLEGAIAQQVLEQLLPVFLEVTKPGESAGKISISLDASAVELAGSYDTPDAFGMEVRLLEGRLSGTLTHAGVDIIGFDLIPQSDAAFTIRGSSFDGEPITFERDRAGKVDRLILWGLPFFKLK